MRLCPLVCLLLLLLCSAAGEAAAADPVVQAMQKRYDGLKTMKCAYTQTLIHKESGGREERKGMLYFSKPLLVRWETASPVRELLVVNEQAIWNVFFDEEKAYKYTPDVGRDTDNLLRVVTGQARLEQDFLVESSVREGELVRLLLYPKEPTQAMTEAEFWVEASGGLVKRLRVTDFYGNQNEIRFDTQELDVALAASLFTYAPSGNIRVEDRSRNSMVAPPLLR